MGFQERICEPQADSEHEQHKSGDQNIDQPAFACGFSPATMS
jgi:hypothetical protein